MQSDHQYWSDFLHQDLNRKVKERIFREVLMANCLVVASPSCLINEGRALSSRSCREVMLSSHSRGEEDDEEYTQKDEVG